MNEPTALILEDDPKNLEQMLELVRSQRFVSLRAASIREARDVLAERPVDVVISDLVLPDGSGLELLENVDDSTEVVFVTGQATVETVITALRKGALDYLTKPVDVTRLKQLLGDVARSKSEYEGRSASLESARTQGRFGHLIGRSKPMMKLFRQIQKVAPTEATVLLQGETGTGKEVCALTIHEMSERGDEPFVALNCGAVSTTLIESELFGHEKGSFTGANKRHVGVFERANRGTLFLDEITEMPMELQIKLLRVLEARTFHRVGGEASIQTNARLIAATNRAPEEAVREGKLREDLFYRLRVFPIVLPTLHQRGEDIQLLAREFLDQHNKEAGASKTLTDEAVEWLTHQDWPGNVRELRNSIHRAFILAEDRIGVDSLVVGDKPAEPAAKDAAKDAGGELTSSPAPLLPNGEIRVRVGSSIAEVEKVLIEATLAKFGGNKQKSARVLGISLKTLYSRLSVYRAAARGSD